MILRWFKTSIDKNGWRCSQLRARILFFEWIAMPSSMGPSQPGSPALQVDSLLSELPGKPLKRKRKDKNLEWSGVVGGRGRRRMADFDCKALPSHVNWEGRREAWKRDGREKGGRKEEKVGGKVGGSQGRTADILDFTETAFDSHSLEGTVDKS